MRITRCRPSCILTSPGWVGRPRARLRRLAGEGGTPFHVFFPDVMLGTVGRFRRVMDDAGNLDGRIYFAVKANDAEFPRRGRCRRRHRC